MFNISRLHFITHDHIDGHDHASLAKAACEGGVDWVQFRTKGLNMEKIKSEALKTQEVCRRWNARFIINDYVDLAFEIGADGVHLGKNDMDPIKAREILGPDFIIGGTANSLEDIIKLNAAQVNYIGAGPLRFTQTKENLSPVLGLSGYQKLISECKRLNHNIPLIAIGGIGPGDIPKLLETGLYGVAVSSFINSAGDKAAAAGEILEIIHSTVSSVKK